MVVASMVLGLFSDNSHSLDYKLLFLVAFAVVKFEFNHQVRSVCFNMMKVVQKYFSKFNGITNMYNCIIGCNGLVFCTAIGKS